MTLPIVRVLLLIVCSSTSVIAQDSPKQACSKAAELYSDDDIVGALEEAQWCVTLLKQAQQDRIKAVFPDSLQGFTGADIEHQRAFGFSSTVRIYRKDNHRLTVTLSDGNGMSTALSALAQFAGSGKKTRIQKRSANIIVDGSHTQILVTLKTGGLLTFEARNMNKNTIIDFAQAFPVAKLDEARQ